MTDFMGKFLSGMEANNNAINAQLQSITNIISGQSSGGYFPSPPPHSYGQSSGSNGSEMSSAPSFWNTRSTYTDSGENTYTQLP